MDKIVFTGNVGKDPDYEEKDGWKRSRMSVAVTHYAKGEKSTEWRSVAVFGKTAEFCRDYVRKGAHVVVIGNPTPRYYKNKLEEIISCIDVVADSVELVGAKGESGSASPGAPAPQSANPEQSGLPGGEDELPF